MSTTTSPVSSVLNSLIVTCKDGEAGFLQAAEDVINLEFKSLFVELSVQRRQFATELKHLVNGLGDDAETTGSTVGALHRGWIDFKASLTSGDERAVLAECERGEDSAVAEYREALAHDDLPTNVRIVIEAQAAGVQAAHDRVRNLRERFTK